MKKAKKCNCHSCVSAKKIEVNTNLGKRKPFGFHDTRPNHDLLLRIKKAILEMNDYEVGCEHSIYYRAGIAVNECYI